MKRFLYLICMLVVAMGCKEVFITPPQSLLNASFYNSITKSSISPVIVLHGLGNDGILYKDTAAGNALFPLNPKQDSTQFIIWFDSKADSITFIDTVTQRYASVETGLYYDYKLLKVRYTHNRIDSIKITDNLVSTKWNENIKIYIRPLQSFLWASFYNSETSQPISPVISVHEVGSTILLKNKIASPNVLLPLTIKDTTRYIISFDSKDDSLTFIQKTTKIEATPVSSAYYVYKLLSVKFTHNSIDSIIITDSLVTTNWNENIKLYLHNLPVSGN